MKKTPAIFDCSLLEQRYIDRIAARAVRLANKLKIKSNLRDIEMDITACHCNGMALDLEKLLKAKDETFGHDIFGIRRHINRSTGEIGDCFVPRTALPDPTVT